MDGRRSETEAEEAESRATTGIGGIGIGERRKRRIERARDCVATCRSRFLYNAPRLFDSDVDRPVCRPIRRECAMPRDVVGMVVAMAALQDAWAGMATPLTGGLESVEGGIPGFRRTFHWEQWARRGGARVLSCRAAAGCLLPSIGALQKRTGAGEGGLRSAFGNRTANSWVCVIGDASGEMKCICPPF